MNKLYIKWILPVLMVGMFLSCNNQQNNTNEEYTEDIENQADSNDEFVSDFDNLEEKMDNIMNESEDIEGDAHKDVTIIKAGSAKSIEVNVNIGAGKLKLSSGSSELFTGGFIYTDADWKPEINYKIKGDKGYLNVRQPESNNNSINNDDKYAWNLKFTENLPLDFNIEVGAGLSEIYLSDLQIGHFNMNMGVGKTEIDMSGKWNKSAEIHLNGGIGLSIIHLPKNVGVIINVEKGLGSVDVNNLIKKSNSEYVNEAYDKSNIILKIYLKTGIGKIEID